MPDFGIFRGFNEKLFGDKLYAGQLPTQLGLIGSESFGFDTDAQAFFDRVATAGGTLSATEKLAIDTLVKQMKTDGIWSKMEAIYPMVGASAAACAQNLKSSSFTGTFTSGWTFASSGVTGNGSSAYMDTNLTPRNLLDPSSAHFSIYLRSNIQGVKIDIGSYDGANGRMFIYPNLSNSTYATIGNSGYPVGVPYSNTDSRAFFQVIRLSSTNTKIYQNSTKKIDGSITSSILPNQKFFIGAMNEQGTASTFSNREISFSSIGYGLTDTEASDFYTAVQAFQTTLSRQV